MTPMLLITALVNFALLPLKYVLTRVIIRARVALVYRTSTYDSGENESDLLSKRAGDLSQLEPAMLIKEYTD